jgi:hypothetical protein
MRSLLGNRRDEHRRPRRQSVPAAGVPLQLFRVLASRLDCRGPLFIFAPVTPALMPQPLANFVQPGSQPIALPRWSRIHPVADFAQALAHAHAVFATAFPFLPIARTARHIAALRARPLDLDDLAVDDARFDCPSGGIC